jgi:hypothetical protein
MIRLLSWLKELPANALQAGVQYPHEASLLRETTAEVREKSVKKAQRNPVA